MTKDYGFVVLVRGDAEAPDIPKSDCWGQGWHNDRTVAVVRGDYEWPRGWVPTDNVDEVFFGLRCVLVNSKQWTVEQVRPTRTLAQLAQEAIDIQDASNLCGLVQGWARAALELRSIMPTLGTAEFGRHPIMKMWVAKLYDLAGGGRTADNKPTAAADAFGEAYDWCREHARAGTWRVWYRDEGNDWKDFTELTGPPGRMTYPFKDEAEAWWWLRLPTYSDPTARVWVSQERPTLPAGVGVPVTVFG